MNENLINHPCNQDFFCGHFPQSELLPLNLYHSPDVDLESMIEGLDHIINPYDCYPFLFGVIASLIKQAEKSITDFYISPVNYWINLGLSIGRLNEKTEITELSIRLSPVVTYFDKILWFCAAGSGPANLSSAKMEYYFKQLAWSYLLIKIQKQELETGLTINLKESITQKTLFYIILGLWENVDDKLFIKLTDHEIAELQQLNDNRQNILHRYEKERNDAEQTVSETNDSWTLFIKLINELANKESYVIEQINKPLPAIEKLQAIKDYEFFIKSIEQNECFLNNQRIPLEKIAKAIEKRFESATDYVCLSDNIDNPFRLTPASVLLIADPKITFSYLRIVFHQFRLSPTKENALAFISIALKDLMMNLSIQSDLPTNFDEMISSFYSIASSFIDQHKSTIESLSFHELQKDSIAPFVFNSYSSSYYYGESRISNLSSNLLQETITQLDESSIASFSQYPIFSFYDLLNAVCNSIIASKFSSNDNRSILNEIPFQLILDDSDPVRFIYDLADRFSDLSDQDFEILVLSKMPAFISGLLQYYSIDDKIAESMHVINNQMEDIKKSGEARQIVISINIVYMMHEVLRMMKGNNELLLLFQNPETLIQYERKLKRLRRMIETAAYSDIAYFEDELDEYREDNKISSQSIAEIEKREEQKRNSQFVDRLIDAINSIVEGFENQNVEQLIHTKERIRSEISATPDSDAKKQLAEWIDSINVRLCKAFVHYCEKNRDEFENTQMQTVNAIGEQWSRLPKPALDSLTTAEMLYNRYATIEYAEKGFDYSSISSLYYQSFEEAFNKMVWSSYAKYLNDLIEDRNNINIIIDYLPGSLNNISHYYMTKGKRVLDYCVFGSIYHLLEEINQRSTAPKFCEYFSFCACYDDPSSMINDKLFMQDLYIFIDSIKNATPNRNKASHGGIIINIDQCRNDKKAVLDELSTLRSSSLGLIQQLLSIIKRVPE